MKRETNLSFFSVYFQLQPTYSASLRRRASAVYPHIAIRSMPQSRRDDSSRRSWAAKFLTEADRNDSYWHKPSAKSIHRHRRLSQAHATHQKPAMRASSLKSRPAFFPNHNSLTYRHRKSLMNRRRPNRSFAVQLSNAFHPSRPRVHRRLL